MIRPQMKKAKEHKALLAGLAKSDEVVTQGGIVGKAPGWRKLCFRRNRRRHRSRRPETGDRPGLPKGTLVAVISQKAAAPTLPPFSL